jgi:hypothetical protein
LHLKRLNGDSHQSGAPTLQYVILLDLKNLSTQSLVWYTNFPLAGC